MRITLTNVFVDDQRAALAFYTDVLGFEVHHDIALGEDAWLTVVSPEQPGGPELLLEPSKHRAVGPFRAALKEDGIPTLQLSVDDVRAEHARLVERGVGFTQEPVEAGEVVMAVFDDTCGNLVQIVSTVR
jgi:catechol 2,3-dioxygenase-like lactoylglutathione lyase family enzyme